MNKKGAMDMTVGKLITIILIIAVIVLSVFVIYFGLWPTSEKIEGKFNEVLILLHLMDDPGENECTRDALLDSGEEAVVLFRDLGTSTVIQGESSFSICTLEGCILDLSGDGKYRFKDGSLEKSGSGESWYSTRGYLFETNKRSNDVKKEWELYNGAMDLLERDLGKDYLDAAYAKITTKQFELYGSSSGWFDFSEKYALWENGEWKIYKGRVEINSTTDDSEAIGLFYRMVKSWVKDDVYSRVSMPKIPGAQYLDNPDYHGESIDLLVGGDNGKLDSDSEKEKLISAFKLKKEKLLAEATLSPEQIKKFSEEISQDQITAGGETYNVTFSMDGRLPLVTLQSLDGDSAWIVYDNDVNLFGDIQGWNAGLKSYDYVKLRNYPTKLTFNSPMASMAGSDEIDYTAGITRNDVVDPPSIPSGSLSSKDKAFGPDEKFYKLPRDIFDEAYKINRAKEFIFLRCI